MRILTIGDSLGLPRPHRMNSYSPNEKELAVSYEQTYSSIIQKDLFQELGSKKYFEVINRSRRFCTLKDVIHEFFDYLFYYEPDVIILQIGIVDCWFREDGKQIVNIEQFKEYLNKIILLLTLRPNCTLIIVGISPTSVKMDNRYSGQNSEVKKYNDIYKAAVNNKSVYYIDMERYVDPVDIHKYILPDDHHLNPVGNQLVANECLKIIKSIIYNKFGCELYEQQNLKGALTEFDKAYRSYSYNTDNLYNYLLMLYENQQMDELLKVAEFCHEYIDDYEIEKLLNSMNL